MSVTLMYDFSTLASDHLVTHVLTTHAFALSSFPHGSHGSGTLVVVITLGIFEESMTVFARDPLFQDATGTLETTGTEVATTVVFFFRVVSPVAKIAEI